MTPTPKLDLHHAPAVSASPTAMGTSVPFGRNARQRRPSRDPGTAPLPSSAALRPTTASAGMPNLVASMEHGLLFAHAGCAAFTSRTRGFAQHVV
jgi:hypothetical protein